MNRLIFILVINDSNETVNIAAERPEVVKELLSDLELKNMVVNYKR